MSVPSTLAALTCLALSFGCASAPVVQPTTQAAQQAMTPDAALTALQQGNQRFAAGQTSARDLRSAVQASAEGQYPFAVVLSCLDSRIPVEAVFDQGIGDLFVARVAGNFVNTDILGSMEFATQVVGAKLIVVMGHDKCGAVKGSCDHVELGHVTQLVSSIKPSVEAVAGPTCSSKDGALVDRIAEHNVRRNLDEIRSKSEVIRKLESEGKVKLVGAMYQLSTGQVSFLSPEKL